MLTLSAKIRKVFGKKVKNLRKKGILPAILYGPKIKNLPLQINLKEFKKVFEKVGESTIFELLVGKKKYSVIIHDLQRDPLSNEILHVDFYQPPLAEKIVAKVPLVFKGESMAEKKGGVLVKNITEIEVEAFPKDLPHEIEVDLSKLKNFEDHIFVKDLPFGEKVKPSRPLDEIVVYVIAPEKKETKE